MLPLKRNDINHQTDNPVKNSNVGSFSVDEHSHQNSSNKKFGQGTAIHWYSVFQLVLTAIVIIGLWGIAFMLAIIEVSGLLLGASGTGDTLSSLMLVAVAGVSGLLLVPSAMFAFTRLMGRQPPQMPAWLTRARFGLLIVVFPLVLLLGYLSTFLPAITWLVLPILHVLAIGLPILWVVYIGVRGLSLGSPQRMWGVFGSGLVLGPTFSLIAEALVGAVFFVLLLFVLSAQPGVAQKFAELAEWVSEMQPSPEAILEKFAPYVMNPVVIFFVFLIGAVIVPFLEEIFKPVGVWLLLGRKMSPAEGFAAGVISGAGFALLESLVVINNGQDWALLVVARIGTAVVHILTAGVTGWGLIMAWRYKRFFHLLFAYLAAVSLHGLWNGISLLTIFPSLASMESVTVPDFLTVVGSIVPFALVALTLVSLVTLLWANRALARAYPIPQPSPPEDDERVLYENAVSKTSDSGQEISQPAMNGVLAGGESNDDEIGGDQDEKIVL
jgi:hypothetical protein